MNIKIKNKIDGPLLSDMVTDELILKDAETHNGVTYHYDIAQNSPEWDQIRKGKVTASPAKSLLVSAYTLKGKLRAGSIGSLSSGAVTYANKIAKQRYCDSAGNGDFRHYSADMERGHETEDQAARLFEAITGFKTTEVGFLSKSFDNATIGCSPDRIILDDNGIVCAGLEMKSANSDIQFTRIMSPQELEKEHFAQVQFQMFISGANKWYISSFNDDYTEIKDKLVIREVLRDEKVMKEFESKLCDLEAYIDDILFDLNVRRKIEQVW
tara:strand:- start:726 stop:1532 length:807 start_codon:yes stop_codon:yes gene_type:complete